MIVTYGFCNANYITPRKCLWDGLGLNWSWVCEILGINCGI